VDETSFRNPKLQRGSLIAYKAFADLAGKASLFAITILAARRFSPEAFGIFSLGSTLGWIAAVAADAGMQLHLAREVARRPDAAAALLRSWLRVRIWGAAAALLAVALGLFAFAGDVSFALPIALLAVVYACSGVVEFLHYFYRGLSRSDVESSLTLWLRGGTLVCGVAALVWWPDVTLLAVAMLVPAAATLAVSLRIARRMVPDRPDSGLQHALNAETAETADNRYLSIASAAIFWRDVLPIGAGIVFSALYFRVDIFLVQRWSGTEAVAIYNAVFRLVEALRLFPAAVLAVMLPLLCRAADLRPLTRMAIPITVGALIASALLWASAGVLIPLVYGAPYAAAVPAFRILLLAFPLLSLNLALTHQLVGWHAQRTYAAICALALVVNVALNARLIPALAIEGAAWATLGTEVFLTAACLAALGAVRRKARTAAGSPVARDVTPHLEIRRQADSIVYSPPRTRWTQR
jgi:O-antigen/teichoic acid export membrane protein